ncbi:MAG: DUF6873 family GME fold protein [Saccharofermentanales bacterium]
MLPVHPNPAMPGVLGRHADLQYCLIRRTSTLYCAKGCMPPRLPFSEPHVVMGSLAPHPPYPHDTVCNIAVCGGYAIGNRKCTDPVLIRETESAGLEWIDVRQGYAGCGCIVLESGSDTALITSDNGIARACSGRISTLLLPPQETIRLPEYRHGFIGGIGGLHDGIFYITGSLEHLASGERIRQFIGSIGIKIIELSEDAPLDIGGLIFIES